MIKKEISKFKKSNKKGQAAIEFLMTYGWMLLVVLIVGALIFSFVDFGGLLPSQVDLSPPLRGDNALVSASSDNDKVNFIFSYVGSRSSTITPSESTNLIKPDVGDDCTLFSLEKKPSLTTLDIKLASVPSHELQIINGDLVEAIFKCKDASLTKGNSFEGEATLKVKDSRTQFDKSSKGRVRVNID